MPKKLTYKFVKNKFKKRGYVLLDKKYKNSKIKLNYICHKGHQHSIKWDHFKVGHGCPYCADRSPICMDFVREKFEKENCVLLSTNYINNKQRLDYVCSNGHSHKISWHNWKQGNRCPYCSGKAKKNVDFIRSEFEKENYILLTNKYKNSYQKLNYICSNGHRHLITWSMWQQGQRCPICAVIKNSGSTHYNWRGGISCEPYCYEWSFKEFKDIIKERDGDKCLNPDCFGNIYRLGVHHIDYDKKNCEPQNLITLCRSCNSRANYNRKFWINFYNNIMAKRGLLC